MTAAGQIGAIKLQNETGGMDRLIFRAHRRHLAPVSRIPGPRQELERNATKKLKELEDMLPNRMFFRVHNSYIVHLLKVKEYLRSEGYLVLLNQKKIPVSRTKKEAFLNRMS